MRIAVISRMFRRSAGGAESYAVALVQQQAARHEVHVFSQETDQPVAGVRYHKVICLGQKPRWLNQLVFAFATWRATRSGFDVVHSHENTWHGEIQTVHVRPVRFNLFQGRESVALAQRWLKVALSPRLLTYLRLEGARFQSAPGRHVVATSDSLRNECLAAYPLAAPLLSVIPPGTALPDPLPSQAEARRRLALAPDKRLLLFVANDYARKGLDALLAAMAQLPAEVHLMVAGHRGQMAKYQAMAEQLGVAGQVHFLGSLADLTDAYCAADVLVHPTLEDSFAMVVLEAMAHGLPVIVSGPTYCGIASHLQDAKEALLVRDPRDALQLAKLISRLLGSDTLAQQLRMQGRAFAERHSWASASLQYERLYGQVAGLP